MRPLSTWFRRRPRSAIDWLVRTKCNTANAYDDERLKGWVAKSPSNERDYQVAKIIWQMSGELKGDPEIDRLDLPARHTAPSRIAMRIGAALLTSGAALFLLYLGETLRSNIDAHYETTVGQQRTIDLPDGSRVLMNTASTARISYTLWHRDIWLDAGEATFEVAKNRWRPFEVHTAKGTARALGTRFDVFTRPFSLEVAIIEGTVDVRAIDSTGTLESTVVHGGQLATVDSAARLSVSKAEIDRIVNRQVERLEFDGSSVANAVAEFNRYSRHPIVASTPELAAMRISGVFHAGDTEAFVRSLETALSVRVITRDNTYVIVKRTLGSSSR
jgi:transmembrane sensor